MNKLLTWFWLKFCASSQERQSFEFLDSGCQLYPPRRQMNSICLETSLPWFVKGYFISKHPTLEFCFKDDIASVDVKYKKEEEAHI